MIEKKKVKCLKNKMLENKLKCQRKRQGRISEKFSIYYFIF